MATLRQQLLVGFLVWMALACSDHGSPSSSRDDLPPLPAAFRGADKVELVMAFLQSDFVDAGAPIDAKDGDIALAVRNGRGHVLYVGAFGCQDPYAAFVKRDGSNYNVLLRLNIGHNACGGALYATRVVLDGATDSAKVTINRQDDLDGKVRVVGSARAGANDADCVSFSRCDEGEHCHLEGARAEGLGPVDGPDDTHTCVQVDVCGGSVCAWTREACIVTCGNPSCAVLESFPVQVRCN